MPLLQSVGKQWARILHGHEPWLKSFLLPLFAVSLSVQLNWWIAPHVSVLPLFLCFFAAILVAAWYGTWHSGAVAVVLSTLAADYFFMKPYNSVRLQSGDVGALFFFAVAGLAVTYLVHYLRTNQEQLRQSIATLEEEVARERTRLRRQEKRLGELISEVAITGEREREQLGQELHDYLAQLLALARLKLELAKAQLPSSATEARRHLIAINEVLEKSMQYVRTLMAELQPVELKQSGLIDALRALAAHMSRLDLAVDVEIGSNVEPPPEREALLLYQSARELLMNVVKHAQVGRAVVVLKKQAGELVLVVRDEGRGFDAATPTGQTDGRHFGLSSITDRMTAIGGTLTIESAVGRGTTATMRLPLTAFPSEVLIAAEAIKQDRVGVKPAVSPNQERLPL
ncbi:MAG TPA: DUF4118 domain-containing protein [Nitrospira sp.]|nr:DUF4118 domain-containing protein [Nitrospira sp.]